MLLRNATFEAYGHRCNNQHHDRNAVEAIYMKGRSGESFQFEPSTSSSFSTKTSRRISTGYQLSWVGEMSCVMFFDESRFSLLSDSRRTLIWRAPGTRYHQDNTIERHSYGGAR
ncbi:hypothetical protein TNCV_3240071 [Trichonephila clavipes]|nr:hypothetical protein TNCV_3240071 [Trichonephila clavipes]